MNGHKNQKKYIFISTSRPGNARPDYFFNLANSFVNRNYKVVMLIDKNSLVLSFHENSLQYYLFDFFLHTPPILHVFSNQFDL